MPVLKVESYLPKLSKAERRRKGGESAVLQISFSTNSATFSWRFRIGTLVVKACYIKRDRAVELRFSFLRIAQTGLETLIQRNHSCAPRTSNVPKSFLFRTSGWKSKASLIDLAIPRVENSAIKSIFTSVAFCTRERQNRAAFPSCFKQEATDILSKHEGFQKEAYMLPSQQPWRESTEKGNRLPIQVARLEIFDSRFRVIDARSYRSRYMHHARQVLSLSIDYWHLIFVQSSQVAQIRKNPT